ncbi:MAG: hypothetical protein KDB99_14320, partial [Chitinophagaceae bacterium]|nr:hypothetical protein [Chitinophagaceae bacterium]
MTIAVLGAGMVGRAIALDLAKEHMVTSFDLSEKSLDILKKRNIAIRTVIADLTNYTKYPEWLS